MESENVSDTDEQEGKALKFNIESDIQSGFDMESLH